MLAGVAGGASCPLLLDRGGKAAFTKLLGPLPPASSASARGMAGNIFPHGEINCPPAPTRVKDPGPPLRDPVVGLLRPSFRRLQSLHRRHHETASARLWCARKVIFCESAAGHGLPGLAAVEIAKLADKPPQALAALWPLLTFEAAERQLGTASQTLDTGAHQCEARNHTLGTTLDFKRSSVSMTTEPAVVVSRFQSSCNVFSAAPPRSSISSASPVVDAA